MVAVGFGIPLRRLFHLHPDQPFVRFPELLLHNPGRVRDHRLVVRVDVHLRRRRFRLERRFLRLEGLLDGNGEVAFLLHELADEDGEDAVRREAGFDFGGVVALRYVVFAHEVSGYCAVLVSFLAVFAWKEGGLVLLPAW